MKAPNSPMIYAIRSTKVVSIFVALILLAAAARAEIVGWRGDGSGHLPDATPPTTWTLENNLVWKTETADWSNASPILVGDRLFVCGEETTLTCLSADDGRILWERGNRLTDVLTAEQLAEPEANREKIEAIREELEPLYDQWRKAWNSKIGVPGNPEADAAMARLRPQIMAQLARIEDLEKYKKARTHEGTCGYSSPTPISDGERVYVAFGTGVAAAYTLEGDLVWRRFVERPREINNWGFSASPRFADGKLIIHLYHLMALDPETGETIWSAESAPSFGTEYVARLADTEVIVTPTGDVVRARDGHKLASGLFRLPYNGPLLAEGVAYGVDQHGASAVALELTNDDRATTRLLWSHAWDPEGKRGGRFYASPLLHEGLLYAISWGSRLTVFDAKTGEIHYTENVPFGRGMPYPSIMRTGDKIVVGHDGGRMLLMEPGLEYRPLAMSDLGRGFRTTPFIDGDRMYIRALDGVYCVDLAPDNR